MVQLRELLAPGFHPEPHVPPVTWQTIGFAHALMEPRQRARSAVSRDDTADYLRRRSAGGGLEFH